jgi:hypothetical protein
MKREAYRHPKMLDLASRLGIPVAFAIGLMCKLLDWAADFAPQGDVGKYSNGTIAMALGWTGDPDKLVDALLAARWLDQCRQHRLLIHDLPDHAERWWCAKLAKLGLEFLRPQECSTEHSQERSAEHSENGSTARSTEHSPPRDQTKPNLTKPITKPNQRHAFVKPTIGEVRAYCVEIGSRVDPQAFFDHYESNGWKVGKNPMRDWKASIRNWGRRDTAAVAKRGDPFGVRARSGNGEA